MNPHLSHERHEFVPDWAKGIVWYQIFPERFRNGDPRNDPTVTDIDGSYPHDHQAGWQPHPWTADWYALQPYERLTGESIWTHLQRRRYGGDLQGILDQLDYLSDLGINALYLNPVFESPSLHKYDGATYHHIDPTFGPDPEGDRQLIATEIPDDPATWIWTEADRLMLALINAVHQRGMRIIIDGVFNHMGLNSWAYRDVVQNRQNSKYKDWFKIRSWGDGQRGEGFAHQGWANCYELPELRQDENGIVNGPKDYIFACTSRWMDPDGDGDPSDGIDGWRLDVAYCVAHPFWKDWRRHVRAINPQAYLVAEIFEILHDIQPYLQGDEFDAAMNYGFAVTCSEFFIQSQNRLSVTMFDEALRHMREKLPQGVMHVMQNLLDSHDTARLATHIVNRDQMNYRDWVAYQHMFKNGESGSGIEVRKPSPAEYHLQKLCAIFQMTYVGAPMIYYGDETGMWGANDPCCRKPMIWPDMAYEPEVHLPDGSGRDHGDSVTFNWELFRHYQNLIRIRNASPALQRGDYATILMDDERELYAFTREYEKETVVVIINRSSRDQTLTLLNLQQREWEDVLNGEVLSCPEDHLTTSVRPQWARILVA